jgi:hypothetical protein
MRAETLYEIATKLVELGAALTMVGGAGILLYRIKKAPAGVEPLSGKAVQLIAITTGLPLILILGLEERLDTSTIGTLTGFFLGYVLASLQFQPRKPGPPE